MNQPNKLRKRLHKLGFRKVTDRSMNGKVLEETYFDENGLSVTVNFVHYKTECQQKGHLPTSWDGYWDVCGRCGQRFINPEEGKA